MSIEILKQVAPIPSLLSYKKVVVIGPHPDDIEIGAGGTINKLIEQGSEVTFVIVTDGGCGSQDFNQNVEELIQIRKKESLESSHFLHVFDTIFLEFEDGGFYDKWDVAKKIAEILIKINPDLVICPDPLLPSEIHPDHIKTGKATNTALIMSNYPLMAKRNHIFFDENKLTNFRSRTLAYYYTNRPNQCISLSDINIAKRNESIMKHSSQFVKTEDLNTLLMYLDIKGKILGEKIKESSAEGFFVLGPIHQHCFTEVNQY